jgi:hypothetical protein
MNRLDKSSFILGVLFSFFLFFLSFFSLGFLVNGSEIVSLLQFFVIKVKMCMIHLPEGVCASERLKESLLIDISILEEDLFERLNHWMVGWK